MSYRKFDDPLKSRDEAPRKVYNAVQHEALRRALASVLNRIISGNITTAGTSAAAIASSLCATCGTGETGGVGASAAVAVLINGRAGTRSAAGSFWLPAGTQGSGTYVKYLICGGFGSSGTCLAGNESTSSTGAYLPDCPEGYVALGYMQYYANATCGWNRGANVCSGSSGSAGTATFVNLVHMPFFET
jgi:hypothetical protein